MCKTLSVSIFFICVLILAGCSGSGSSSSQDATPVQFPSSGSAIGSVTVANTSLQFSETTSVSATFKKTDGTPASGVNVNFSTTLGTITPASGIAATDANGTATVQLTVGATSGQGQVTASATVDNNQITKTGLFSVSLPPLKLSVISLGLSTISYGGSTSVAVTVTNADGTAFTGQEVDVTFSSTQAASGKATLTSPVRTVNHVATVTYQAITATGSDTITAAISGDSKTATISVTPLAASSISFVSASPASIGLKGMGGAGIQENSKVTFKVLDTAGQPKANQQIDFALNTTVGGLSLVSSSASTASDGTASTIVQAGVIATSIRVTATIRGTSPLIATQSDQLVISTGVPSQDGFSISIKTLNPETWNIDGVVDQVTARLSDHFHNPVPDGTAVYFTTSGGSIQPSCVTTLGACSVDWTSQNPRPANGRAVILAYAVGEESFLDLNGNGLADNPSGVCTDIPPIPGVPGVGAAKQCGEFVSTPEAYRDDNENGVRDAGETFIDFNGDALFNGPDTSYNGVFQSAAYVGAPKSKHVFSNSTLVMASSSALIANSCGNNITIGLGASKTCIITVNDVNGNTMPAGTTVSFSFTSGGTGTITLISDNIIVPNTSANAGVISTVIMKDSGTAPVGSGVLKVSVSSPGGLVTTRAYSVN